VPGAAAAAAPLLRPAGRTPASLFVIVDDQTLPGGRMRTRPSGSAGGHNGLESIQQKLCSDGYPRLRLGIGPVAPHGDDKLAGLRSTDWSGFVLAPFLPEEREVLGRVLVSAADCAMAWLDGADLQQLMGTYNSSRTGQRPGE
jgi:PTH1 family peptidyl-tRNA hydrolase